MSTPGERIRRERQRRKLRQADLAEEAGVNVRTLSRIENGRVKDSSDIPILEAYLGITDKPETASGGADADHDSRIEAALDEASHMQLLVEMAKRLSRLGPDEVVLPATPLRRPRTDKMPRSDQPATEESL